MNIKNKLASCTDLHSHYGLFEMRLLFLSGHSDISIFDNLEDMSWVCTSIICSLYLMLVIFSAS